MYRLSVSPFFRLCYFLSTFCVSSVLSFSFPFCGCVLFCSVWVLWLLCVCVLCLVCVYQFFSVCIISHFVCVFYRVFSLYVYLNCVYSSLVCIFFFLCKYNFSFYVYFLSFAFVLFLLCAFFHHVYHLPCLSYVCVSRLLVPSLM